jgi:hypothetical protein
LNEAISNADRIEMKMLIDGELIEGIKFAYSTEEEKAGLASDLMGLEPARAECLEEIGALVFLKEEKSIAELKFNVNADCALAWFESSMNEQAFGLSDTLAVLLQQRYELVSAVKGQSE